MARLYARLVGSHDTDGVVGMCKPSVYDEIMAAWDAPDRLAALLSTACDFHIRNPGPYENFVAYPFDCYPAELLAIFRVRQRLGLETPPVSHPLLESPLARPPIPLPEFSEPAMQRIRGLMPTIDIHSVYKPDP